MDKPKVAGSIKPDGRVALRSESINRTNGLGCDAAGTKLGQWAENENGPWRCRGRQKVQEEEPALPHLMHHTPSERGVGARKLPAVHR